MTTEQIVGLLNELHGLDSELLSPLIVDRKPCNQAIADHPTVTVDGPPWCVGLLGILEGIAGLDGDVIEAVWEGRLVGFRVRERKSDS